MPFWKQQAKSKMPREKGGTITATPFSVPFLKFTLMPQHYFSKHQEVISIYFYATS